MNFNLRIVDSIEDMNRAGDTIGLGEDFAEMRQEASLAQHALDQFNDELAQTDRAAASVDKLSSGFGGLSKAVVVANQGLELIQKAWNGIEQLGTMSDARIGADARLANINDGLRTQEQLEAQVMQAANASRSEYAATAELVARVGRQDYFKGSNDSAVAFAETLNKGLIISGASAEEAKGAIIQLSQGIASGVLRGEEFNSIMENGSVIAEMMATSLGVNKGELRSMAEEGLLTTEISDQSLEYLNDIAEVQLLESLESTSSLQLSKEDASLMQQSATAADTNVYYIQYTGGVKINNDVRQGDSWDSIRQKLENALQMEMDTSISGIEEVLYSG